MSNAYFKVPQPINEPVKSYKPGSPEREELKKKLAELKSKQIEAPLIIGGEEVKTGNTEKIKPSSGRYSKRFHIPLPE